MAQSIGPNKSLGIDSSRGHSHSSHAIKSTGKGKFWKRMLVQLSNNKYSDKKPKILDVVEQNYIDRSDSHSDPNLLSETSSTNWSNEDDEIQSPMNRHCSNGYYLIEGNKQVCFEVSNEGDSPYCYMSVFDYDVCPLFVGSDECLIKVEASSISYLDCIIREGRWWADILDYKNIPGFDIVGMIVIAGPDAPFRAGERVATISITGGNARYIVQPCSNLIRIGKLENAQKACSILSAYAPAFALIQEGLDVPLCDRYRRNLLADKDILVNGGMSNHGQAVIHLARLMGARTIYSTGVEEDYRFLTDMGAVALPLNKKALKTEHRRSVDLLIDCTAFDRNDFLVPLVRPGGRIILNHYGDIAASGKHGFRGKIDFIRLYTKSLLSSNCHVCNYLSTFKDDFGLFKRDFEHLLRMMHLSGKERLSPRVASVMNLWEVPDAHFKLQRSNVRGTLICDPWK